jgi:hypothetical protein
VAFIEGAGGEQYGAVGWPEKEFLGGKAVAFLTPTKEKRAVMPVFL